MSLDGKMACFAQCFTGTQGAFVSKSDSPFYIMKTKILLPILLIVGALLVGCATSAALNNLHIGMDRSQVISLLGQPDSTSAQANVEYLTYYLAIDTQEGPARDQPYLVRLVDGKVESFGRMTQLNDLYLRPVTNATPGTPNFPQTNLLGAGVMTAPAASAAPAAPDLATEIEKLKALKDQGVLTDQEFTTAKAKLLGTQP